MSQQERQLGQGEATHTLHAQTSAYLAAFDARDLARCLEFFSDNATLTFYTGAYSGRSAIEAWHRERFDADLRLVEVASIEVQENMVTIEGTATSARLRAWKIARLNAVIALAFQGDKIYDAKFSPRLGPLDMLGS